MSKNKAARNRERRLHTSRLHRRDTRQKSLDPRAIQVHGNATRVRKQKKRPQQPTPTTPRPKTPRKTKDRAPGRTLTGAAAVRMRAAARSRTTDRARIVHASFRMLGRIPNTQCRFQKAIEYAAVRDSRAPARRGVPVQRVRRNVRPPKLPEALPEYIYPSIKLSYRPENISIYPKLDGCRRVLRP
ncbi:hypothetical protein HK100_010301 [Physocladia obscura]|uniref:Uncharacterized protein n=1 Tax=Physocladia obscura TaxID=109957 RepID=A0AAD5XAR9_9FUNG|nr:hypothetical protein HK100_010301 [Physocladia obscura]